MKAPHEKVLGVYETRGSSNSLPKNKIDDVHRGDGKPELLRHELGDHGLLTLADFRRAGQDRDVSVIIDLEQGAAAVGAV